MKYTVEVEIKKPIEQVIALFDNPKHMPKWMDGLESFEHLSGTPGQPGAKSKLKFRMGKREMEMIETVITRKLPEEFSGSYEMNGVKNIVKNKFIKTSENSTKYISECEFQFTGFMKIIAFLFPGSFKKQSLKYMNNFKRFAES